MTFMFVCINVTAATSPTNPLPAEFEAARPATVGEEELQLQLALAMSKEEHEEETRKYHTDEVKVQLAIEESKREVEEETVGTRCHGDIHSFRARNVSVNQPFQPDLLVLGDIS